MPAKIDWSMLLHEEYKSVRGMLHDMYVVKELGLAPIAKKLGVDKRTVAHKLKSIGIPLRSPGCYWRMQREKKEV